jgi:threonine dehydrogenase-like Zn-dependent dehydrogenase
MFGAGLIGLLCCAVASAFGAATVIAVDIVEPRLDVANQVRRLIHIQDAGPIA